MNRVQYLADFRSTAVDEDIRRDLRRILLEGLCQAVLEQSLRDSDENGSTQTLEELYARAADRNPLMGQYILDDEHAKLKARSDTET